MGNREQRKNKLETKESKMAKTNKIIKNTIKAEKNGKFFDYLVFDNIYDHGQKMVSRNEEEALKDYINEFVFGTKASIGEMEFFVVKLENNAKIQKFKVKYDEIVVTKQR